MNTLPCCWEKRKSRRDASLSSEFEVRAYIILYRLASSLRYVLVSQSHPLSVESLVCLARRDSFCSMHSVDFKAAVKQEEEYSRKVHPTAEDIPGCMSLLDSFLMCNGT